MSGSHQGGCSVKHSACPLARPTHPSPHLPCLEVRADFVDRLCAATPTSRATLPYTRPSSDVGGRTVHGAGTKCTENQDLSSLKAKYDTRSRQLPPTGKPPPVIHASRSRELKCTKLRMKADDDERGPAWYQPRTTTVRTCKRPEHCERSKNMSKHVHLMMVGKYWQIAATKMTMMTRREGHNEKHGGDDEDSRNGCGNDSFSRESEKGQCDASLTATPSCTLGYWCSLLDQSGKEDERFSSGDIRSVELEKVGDHHLQHSGSNSRTAVGCREPAMRPAYWTCKGRAPASSDLVAVKRSSALRSDPKDENNFIPQRHRFSIELTHASC